MVIPCLCLFVALSSLFSELVGAKPLHLLTQTVLLLVQTQTSDKQKSTRTLFRKESGSGTNCMVERSNPNPNHCPLGHLWRQFHRK